MKIGAFSDAVRGGSPEAVAQRSRAAGLEVIQLRTDWPGLDLLGSAADRARVRDAYEAVGIGVAALAAYGNLLDPRPERRRQIHERIARLIRMAPELGTELLVTEAGTFHPNDSWADHPHNRTPDAWAELVEVTGQLVLQCERHGVRLAYEPYVNTVLYSAEAAACLAGEIGSPALCFVFDAAGLMTPETLPANREITAAACALLGDRLALAHADDLRYEDGRARWLPLGWGDLDASEVFAGLAGAGFDGALIVEHVAEDLLPEAAAFCRERSSTVAHGAR
jgi:sugar phosphate isomerase/epimerase